LLLLEVLFAFSCNVDESKNEKEVMTINDFNIEENVLTFKSSYDLKLHVIGSIGLPGIYNYKDADIDIVGVSRKGDVWKGSKLVFTK